MISISGLLNTGNSVKEAPSPLRRHGSFMDHGAFACAMAIEGLMVDFGHGRIRYNTSSTRTRRGGSSLRFDYKTFFIYRTCMHRAPARPVHAGFARTCCAVVVQEHPRTWPARDHMPMQRQANTFFTLHTAPFTPSTSCLTLALHIPHFISSQIISDFFLPHVTSSQLFSSHPIPSHMSPNQ